MKKPGSSHLLAIAGIAAALAVGVLSYVQNAQMQKKTESDSRASVIFTRLSSVENRITALEQWQKDMMK